MLREHSYRTSAKFSRFFYSFFLSHTKFTQPCYFRLLFGDPPLKTSYTYVSLLDMTRSLVPIVIILLKLETVLGLWQFAVRAPVRIRVRPRPRPPEAPTQWRCPPCRRPAECSIDLPSSATQEWNLLASVQCESALQFPPSVVQQQSGISHSDQLSEERLLSWVTCLNFDETTFSTFMWIANPLPSGCHLFYS